MSATTRMSWSFSVTRGAARPTRSTKSSTGALEIGSSLAMSSRPTSINDSSGVGDHHPGPSTSVNSTATTPSVTHGIQLSDIDVEVDRTVVGDTGEYAGAAGVQTQILEGFNTVEGVSFTVTFEAPHSRSHGGHEPIRPTLIGHRSHTLRRSRRTSCIRFHIPTTSSDNTTTQTGHGLAPFVLTPIVAMSTQSPVKRQTPRARRIPRQGTPAGSRRNLTKQLQRPLGEPDGSRSWPRQRSREPIRKPASWAGKCPWVSHGSSPCPYRFAHRTDSFPPRMWGS